MALFAGSLLPSVSGAVSFMPAPEDGLFMIGPVKGYTPQIGTLVSMLNYNRSTVIKSVEKLSRNQIDFLLDDHAILSQH